jgi:hypothetical protein
METPLLAAYGRQLSARRLPDTAWFDHSKSRRIASTGQCGTDSRTGDGTPRRKRQSSAGAAVS